MRQFLTEIPNIISVENDIIAPGQAQIPVSILKAHSQSWNNFLTTESTLKMMKNAFSFTSKPLFVLKISKFLFWLFVDVEKRLN